MTARGRVSSSDWDPMRDDYNDSSYDPQYQDHDASGRSMQSAALDHRKLYITNVPAGLNEQGLKTAFEKYGQLVRAFLSRDPSKKYAMITYETAAEARIAMMKLNRTEPLNLHINLAHAKNDNTNKERAYKETKDNSSYVSSSRENKFKNQEELVNEEDEQIDDAMGIDHNFHLEMEKIKLDKLRNQEEQLKCRQKMMMLQMQKRPSVNQAPATVSSSRRLLPDGRVIVQERVQEPDTSFIAGAGDSQNIPGLQRVAEHACIVCGAQADLYCARCAVTPYCGETCQRKDWGKRHRAVCHNLIRLQSNRSASEKAEEPDYNSNVLMVSPPAPLRRPHSPAAGRGAPLRNGHTNGNKGFEEKQRDRGRTHYPNNEKTKFAPPGHHPPPQRAPRPLHSQQKNQQDDDENWGTNDKKTPESTPKPKEHPSNTLGILNIKNFSPKQKIEVPSPKIEKSQPKYEEKVQPKVEETPQPKVSMVPKVEAPKAEEEPKLQMPALNPRLGIGIPNSNVSGTQVEVKRVPIMTLVPSQFLIDTLPIGESFILSVDQVTSACGSKQAGFVCLAMHAHHQTQFNDLLGEIYDGEDLIVPKPGITFAYYEPSDEGWYRARCLSTSKCALLDASRLADMTSQAQCRPLAEKYANIPEFCCVLDGKAEVNMSLKCTILMKTAEGYRVSMDSTADDSYLGEGIVTRWLPEVEQPPKPAVPSVQNRLRQDVTQAVTEPKTAVTEAKPAIPVAKTAVPEPKPVIPEPKSAIPEAKSQVSAQQSSIPDIPRPDIVNNGRYILLHVTSLSRACVRACDDETTAEFESVLQDTALYGMQKAKPLTSPPTRGQEVLCQYEGVHYRALVTRTKAADNRYKVQYAEYGNEEIVSLDKLSACPVDLSLSRRGARASVVVLSAEKRDLVETAVEYVDSIKEQVELVATIPTGDKTAPSGSLVTLTVAKNKENVNKKLEEMCTPEWKKLEEAGGDVVESDVILFSSMSTLPLPTDRQFVFTVTDLSCLQQGIVCGFHSEATEPDVVYGALTDKINEYCNSTLCNDPYLPMVGELCLAKMEPYPQWFRAVVAEHRAGEAAATLLYVDYGNVAKDVPVSHLRKCMPEFARHAALAATADIKDWPESVTAEQTLRAFEFLQVDEEGRGRLPVKRCRRVDEEMSYVIEAPELIAALHG